MQEIIFWSQIPDPITVPFIAAVQDSGRFAVTAAFEKELPEFRRKSGWSDLTERLNDACFLNGENWRETVDKLVREKPSAIHVVTGVGTYKTLDYAIRTALKNGRRCFAVTERPNVTHPVTNLLRRVRAKRQFRQIGRHLDGLFTKGRIGREYYAGIGVPSAKLHDWMYFVDTPEVGEVDLSVKDTARIVFVGRLVPLKRVDLLLRALARVKRPFTLELMGAGDLIEEYTRLAESLGIGDKVQFLGGVPNEETVRRLLECDLLMLPSRYDGWGAVVNEAINAGCAVICSSECGAQDLVIGGDIGEVFKAGDEDALVKSLNRVMTTDRLKQCKQNAFAYRDRIDPRNAVAYFESVVCGHDPILPAPWLDAGTKA